MYTEERQQEIVRLIQQNTRQSVQDLSRQLNVSDSTIRRDLQELEKRGLIKRTHGGAINIHGVGFEPNYSDKKIKRQPEKEMIAEAAVGLIEEGDTIILDSGTTTLEIAKKLNRFQELTVVTNSLLVMKELEWNENVELIVIGGSLRRGILSLVGPLTVQALDGLIVDKAFIATNGIDFEKGITTPNLFEAEVKKAMIQSAKHVIVVADSSKIGKTSFSKVASIHDIDEFITDAKLDDTVLKQWGDLGVDIILAGSDRGA